MLGTLRESARLSEIFSRTDLVLEIASGSNPLMRSDVLLDKYPLVSNEHRTNRKPVRTDGRPFVAGDACNLPFRDQAFDVIVARHVLEHLPDPAQFLAEIRRVGRKVVLKTPSPFAELVHGGYQRRQHPETGGLESLHRGRGTPGHLWFVLAAGEKIVMLAKSEELYPIYLLVNHFVTQNTRYSRAAFFRRHPEWAETTFVTDDANRIELKVLGRVSEQGDEATDIDALIRAMSHVDDGSSRRRLLRAAFAGRKPFDLYDLIACPLCRGPLTRTVELLTCTACAASYPLAEGRPVLLKEAAR